MALLVLGPFDEALMSAQDGLREVYAPCVIRRTWARASTAAG